MLHTVVIWQSGFSQLSHILWLFNSNFRIKYAKKIIWPNHDVASKLNELYPNRDFDKNSPKVQEIGGNELILMVVEDVGSNQSITLKLKSNYRKKYIGNVFHISDGADDGYYNFAALTGLSEKVYTNYVISEDVMVVSKDDEIAQLSAPKFSHLSDVLHWLNEHEQYVVLRNWEDYSSNNLDEKHMDVDILVHDFYRTITLLGATQADDTPERVRYLVNTKHGVIPFDVRFVGDGYYDSKWEMCMLLERELKDSFYVLSSFHYFYSLAYHALFHKKLISVDYVEKLFKIASEAQIIELVNSPNKEKIRLLLKNFLRKNKYEITSPIDPSVTVIRNSWKLTLLPILGKFTFLRKLLTRKKRMRLVNSQVAQTVGSPYAKIITRNVYSTPKYIIKRADNDHAFLLKNEYNLLSLLESETIGPVPISYISDEKFDYLILENIVGKDLARIFYIPKKHHLNLEKQLVHICRILNKYQIVHHDIRPHNLLFHKGSVRLVDFGFASSKKSPLTPMTIKEKFIFNANMAKMGGDWYENELPIKKKDAYAAKQITAAYTGEKTAFELLYDFPVFLKKKLKRYTQYK